MILKVAKTTERSNKIHFLRNRHQAISSRANSGKPADFDFQA
jgi:hypothetical protein